VEGSDESTSDGSDVGDRLGIDDGAPVGTMEGSIEGACDWMNVGEVLDLIIGALDG
jgi:hypothetical protein